MLTTHAHTPESWHFSFSLGMHMPVYIITNPNSLNFRNIAPRENLRHGMYSDPQGKGDFGQLLVCHRVKSKHQGQRSRVLFSPGRTLSVLMVNEAPHLRPPRERLTGGQGHKNHLPLCHALTSSPAGPVFGGTNRAEGGGLRRSRDYTV